MPAPEDNKLAALKAKLKNKVASTQSIETGNTSSIVNPQADKPQTMVPMSSLLSNVF